uniref:Uncharacterized protein n=1 Tax=Anguilla anguilla TaxID=7936 RepID=A0A0E9TK06_ANGAN
MKKGSYIPHPSPCAVSYATSPVKLVGEALWLWPRSCYLSARCVALNPDRAVSALYTCVH